MRFEFATATRIIAGPGTAAEVPDLARSFGRRVLVVTGRSASRVAPLLERLRAASLDCLVFSVAGEPTVLQVQEGAAFGRRERCDLVIACGGGSAIDAAKAIAALMTNLEDVYEYLEVVGRARPLTQLPVPFLALPTTAGTGAEVTRNAVLASPAHGVKASLRHAWLLPKVAVVDPELALDLPRSVTAATGMDALTQLIEPLLCSRANPLTDGFCREGLPRVARSLRKACDEPAHLGARADMAWAALCSGLALANAGLGAVHGFAAPIGGAFHAPHGAVCAALLPHALHVNLRALRARAATHPALPRFEEIARLLTGKPTADAEDAIRWVSELAAALAIPALRSYGMQESDLANLSEKAAAASSMKANPIELTAAERLEIIQRAW